MIECSKNIANEVFVAIPDTPEIDTCAPRVPSRNSKLTYTGCPSRANPTGTLNEPISSKYRAESRCAPAARVTGAPGSGGTYISGSTRVTVTSATSHTSAGSAPCSIRNTSEANRAPSCTASTLVTTPAIWMPPRPGSPRSVTTTSSSCAYWPGARLTEYFSGVAGTVPATSPSASDVRGAIGASVSLGWADGAVVCWAPLLSAASATPVLLTCHLLVAWSIDLVAGGRERRTRAEPEAPVHTSRGARQAG